jgi:hypothetical protein
MIFQGRKLICLRGNRTHGIPSYGRNHLYKTTSRQGKFRWRTVLQALRLILNGQISSINRGDNVQIVKTSIFLPPEGQNIASSSRSWVQYLVSALMEWGPT